MKNLIFLFISLSFLKANSQSYYPFPTDSAEWSADLRSVNWNTIPASTYYQTSHYRIFDTVVVNGLTYQTVFANDSVEFSDYSKHLHALVRENNQKQIFAKYLYTFDTVEFVLYDFSLSPGDTANVRCCLSSSVAEIVLDSIDQILVGNTMRNRFNLHYLGTSGLSTAQWVEGIGDIQNGLFYNEIPALNYWGAMLCYSENGVRLWDDGNNSCYNTNVGIAHHNYNPVLVGPNPASGSLTVKTNAPVLIEIFDQLGRPVIKKEINHEENISVADFKNGIYFVRISSSESSETRTFLIQN